MHGHKAIKEWMKSEKCPKFYSMFSKLLNPLKPEFTIVIFTHYKPRIAVAILDL